MPQILPVTPIRDNRGNVVGIDDPNRNQTRLPTPQERVIYYQRPPRSSGGGRTGGGAGARNPTSTPTDKVGQPISQAPKTEEIIKAEINKSTTPLRPTFSQIDWRTTFGGGIPEQSKITAQTYLNYKLGQGLNLISDKISNVLPKNTLGQKWFFEKKYNFDTTALVKFGAFQPAFASAQTSLLRSIKSGDIIPESKTTFIANVAETEGITTSNVIAKTKLMGKESSAISKSIYKQLGENKAIGFSKSYTFTPTQKGLVIKRIGTVGGQIQSKDVNLLLGNKNILVANPLDDVTSISTKTFSKENSAMFVKKANLDLIKSPLKVSKDIKLEYGFGMFRPINAEKSLFAYRGTTTPRIYGSGTGADIGEFNVKGYIIKLDKQSFDTFMPKSQGSLTKLDRQVITNAIVSTKQIGKASILSSLPKTSGIFKVASSAITINPAQSLYYGTGQYEKTQDLTLSKQLFEEKDKLFLNYNVGNIGLQSGAQLKMQRSQSFDRSFTIPVFKQPIIQKITPIDIFTPKTTQRIAQKQDFFTPSIRTNKFDFKPNDFTFGLPTLDIDLSGSLSPRKTGKQRKKRVPSLYAAIAGITAPKASALEITGITLRPILTNKRRKR